MVHSGRPRRCAPRSLAFLMLLSALTLATGAYAQVGDVTGVIRNAETGETLDYANIVLRRIPDGAQWGTMSLGGGRFFLKGLPAGKYSLKVLYLGYRPVDQEVEVQPGKPLDLRA